jgi:hypothetical protein
MKNAIPIVFLGQLGKHLLQGRFKHPFDQQIGFGFRTHNNPSPANQGYR